MTIVQLSDESFVLRDYRERNCNDYYWVLYNSRQLTCVIVHVYYVWQLQHILGILVY